MNRTEIFILIYCAFGALIAWGTFKMANKQTLKGFPLPIIILTALFIGAIWPIVFGVTVVGMKKEKQGYNFSKTKPAFLEEKQ